MFDILHPVSGDRLDGVYQASVTFRAQAAGVWQAQSLLLNDEAGNSVHMVPTNSAALAAASSFSVINGNLPTNGAPTITSNGSGDNATVSAPENATAVATFIATDPDAGTTFIYSITGGADATLFQINASTGALSFISAPDFEHPTDTDHNNAYLVQVRASDGSLFDDQLLSVTVWT